MVSRGIAIGLSLVLVLGGCGRAAPDPSPEPGAAAPPLDAEVPTLAGRRTFVIVPADSRASYEANEEFFSGALKLLGIEAGRVRAVGSTQAIEGQFQLDPGQPTVLEGENSFSVRLDTLVSNQTKRDEYVREVRDDGGPSFDAYPVAMFKATALDGSAVSNAGRRDLHLRLAGNLTMRDITKPVTFDINAQLAGDTLTGVGTTRVLLSDFGIGPIAFSEILAVSDEIGIEVRFTARAQPR